jgi:hypothetical protein
VVRKTIGALKPRSAPAQVKRIGSQHTGGIHLQAGTGTMVLPSGLIPLVFIVLGVVVTYFIFGKPLVALDDLVVAGHLKDVPGWKCGFRDYNIY